MGAFITICFFIYIIYRIVNSDKPESKRNIEPWRPSEIINTSEENFKIADDERLEREQLHKRYEYNKNHDNDDNLLIYCAGYQYNEAYKVEKFVIGSRVELVPAPRNKVDSNAIKIFYEGFHIGFVPKELAYKANQIIDGKYEATIKQYDKRRKDFFKLRIVLKDLTEYEEGDELRENSLEYEKGLINEDEYRANIDRILRIYNTPNNQ